jgi:hypothetical protein
MYEYDPQTDSWSQLSSHPLGGRNYTKLYGMNNKLFTVGGNDSALNYLNEVWEYDLSSNQWKSLPDIPREGRRGGMSFQSAAALYYTTGLADSSERLVETIKLVDPTYLSESNNQNELKLYPNPVQDFFMVDILSAKRKGGRLLIYSADGSLKVERELTDSANFQVTCRDWPKGVYLVKVVNGNRVFSKKLIKL